MIELFMRCRYSLVVKQILGKDQRTVQFCLSAPLVNLFELFELNIQITNTSQCDWYFFVSTGNFATLGKISRGLNTLSF